MAFASVFQIQNCPLFFCLKPYVKADPQKISEYILYLYIYLSIFGSFQYVCLEDAHVGKGEL